MSEPAYLEELIRHAAALRLAESPEWRALLHYRRPPWSWGVRSLADDPDFFLAEAGKTDPEAELEATLRAFFAPEPRDEEAQHPQCAFIARYDYLKGQLGFDPARLRERRCERYEASRALIRPGGITLVFAEAFMNNPASMFGHTLLRIDTVEDRGKRDLLGWAINFAGATGDEGGPLYAIKGIFGLYSGYFSIAPYYEKVKEYGDWENRDIWEYRLNLSDEEIDRMLRHLWEMQGVAFDYYYFDENCSYQLLALLETARPGLRLTQGFPLWVIPADTVRTVMRQAGLLESVAYRPASATELRHTAAALAPEHLRLARLVGAGDVEPEDALVTELAPAQAAGVLSVAYGHLRHRYLAGDVEHQESAERSRRILIARSRVAVQGSTTPPPPRPETRPDQGHGSARFALEAGWREDLAYVEARIRPALHELIDPEGGYTAGAQIQFLDVAVRYFPERNRVRLQEVVVLDMVSLVPWDGLFRPISWRFDTGLRTRLFPGNGGGSDLDTEPVWRTRGGLGLSARLGSFALLYGLGEAIADVGGALDRDYALGAGGSVGLQLGGASERWRAHLFAEVTRFAVGDRTTALRAGLEQRLTLTKRAALVAHGAYRRDFEEEWVEAGLRLNLYF